MDAGSKIGLLMSKYPELKTLESINNQLRYLLDLCDGRTQDKSKLTSIILGIQAAREIEQLDEDLADLLYKVNEQAMSM